MKKDIVISIKNVSKYYKLYNDPKDRLKEALSRSNKTFHKKFYATKHLNLDIKKGEIIGVVGENGSGKSTLLKLITKVLTPSEGSIEVYGKISALLELGSGFNPEFTGIQNIYFYGTILGFTKSEMDEKIDDIISFAELGEFINQPIKTYSSGMKSRLGFAVAIHVDPDILILDEVLSVGDIHFKKKCYGKMEEFFESGKTIIYVSHSSGEINRLCNRAVMLHNGSIIMDGKPKDVTKYYEKYLFAKDEEKENVLNEIKNSVNKIKVSEQIIEKSNNLNTLKVLEEAYLIPGLEPENRMEYNNDLLDIYDISIRTLDGKKINNLITNERYNLCYKLKFKKNFKKVYYGMQFLNEKGILISGSAHEEIAHPIEKGDILDIRWSFNCAMHKGIYYCNIAVVDNQKKYINRIIDGYVFKVIPSNKLANGLISLQEDEPIIIYNKKRGKINERY